MNFPKGYLMLKYIISNKLFSFQLAGGGLLGIGIWMKIDETIANYLKVI